MIDYDFGREAVVDMGEMMYRFIYEVSNYLKIFIITIINCR